VFLYLDPGSVGGPSVQDVYGSVEKAGHVPTVHVRAGDGSTAPPPPSLARLVLDMSKEESAEQKKSDLWVCVTWVAGPYVILFEAFDGVLSTYDVSVRKKMGGNMRRDRLPSKATISNKSRRPRLGHFPPASQAGRLAGPVFYVHICLFSGV
jgi:hypothetical protein